MKTFFPSPNMCLAFALKLYNPVPDHCPAVISQWQTLSLKHRAQFRSYPNGLFSQLHSKINFIFPLLSCCLVFSDNVVVAWYQFGPFVVLFCFKTGFYYVPVVLGTRSVDQAGPKIKDLPASASQVLERKVRHDTWLDLESLWTLSAVSWCLRHVDISS